MLRRIIICFAGGIITILLFTCTGCTSKEENNMENEKQLVHRLHS